MVIDQYIVSICYLIHVERRQETLTWTIYIVMEYII